MVVMSDCSAFEVFIEHDFLCVHNHNTEHIDHNTEHMDHNTEHMDHNTEHIDHNERDREPENGETDTVLYDPILDMIGREGFDLDDVSTLEEEVAFEAAQEQPDPKVEIEALQREAEMPLEELLAMYGRTIDNYPFLISPCPESEDMSVEDQDSEDMSEEDQDSEDMSEESEEEEDE